MIRKARSVRRKLVGTSRGPIEATERETSRRSKRDLPRADHA
jgi:hypothetical protein